MKHKTNKSISFVPFLVITIGLLASVAFVVLKFSKAKIEEPIIDVYEALVEPDVVPNLKSTKQIASEYTTEMLNMITESKEFEGLATDLYTKVEDTMLSVRVPKESLDVHLNAMLELRELKQSTETVTTEVILEKLLEFKNQISS